MASSWSSTPHSGYPEGQHAEGKKDSRFLSRLNKGISKLSGPMNKAAMSLGCEPFSPQNLDVEFDKAARILKSFCIDGFYTHPGKDNAASGSNNKPEKQTKVLRKIPPEVIRNCKGLAIFTTMRMGLHASGSGGCGILIARLPNGDWSPPSGILIHTIGMGLVAGIDVYDCVAVINNDKGMEGFTRVRATLGGEISASAGPFGAGQTLDSEVLKRQAPVWTYMKSRGLYVGAQVDGTIVVERTEENPRFYGREGLRVHEILRGEVIVPDGPEYRRLRDVLWAVEGRAPVPTGLPPPPSEAMPPPISEGLPPSYEESVEGTGSAPQGERGVKTKY